MLYRTYDANKFIESYKAPSHFHLHTLQESKPKRVILIGSSTYLYFLSKFGIAGAHPGGLSLSKEIFKNENLNWNSQVLDVGCGTGQTAAYLAAQYRAKVTGLDISPIMVTKAKQRMAKYGLPVEIIQSSIEKTPLQSNQFDFIISESVLSFVNKPSALREIFRLLKPSGRFIANELTIHRHLPAMNEEEIMQFYGLDSLHMEKEWIALFNQAGFKNIQIRKQKQPSLPSNTMPEFHYSGNIEPELYSIMYQHVHILLKYQDILGYRVFSCTK